jgi:hypothetical protein
MTVPQQFLCTFCIDRKRAKAQAIARLRLDSMSVCVLVRVSREGGGRIFALLLSIQSSVFPEPRTAMSTSNLVRSLDVSGILEITWLTPRSRQNYPYLNSLVQTIYLQHDHPPHAHLFLLHSVCTPTEGWIVRLYEWGELASRETNLLHASASASKDKGKGRAMGEAEGKGEGGREGEMEMGCKCWEGGWKGKKELRDLVCCIAQVA